MQVYLISYQLRHSMSAEVCRQLIQPASLLQRLTGAQEKAGGRSCSGIASHPHPYRVSLVILHRQPLAVTWARNPRLAGLSGPALTLCSCAWKKESLGLRNPGYSGGVCLSALACASSSSKAWGPQGFSFCVLQGSTGLLWVITALHSKLVFPACGAGALPPLFKKNPSLLQIQH